MRVLNLRLGFATNSSSSHSILILDGNHATDDRAYDDYGWANFTLASPAAKRHYLASQLAEHLGYHFWDDDERNAAIAREAAELVGDPTLELPRIVDHQSTWAFPREWNDGTLIDREFVDALSAFLERSDVVVLGGNDNGGEHPLADQHPGRLWHHPAEERGGISLVCRRDDAGFWTLFDRMTGAKIRLQFDLGEIPERASAPELVDVKITDYCPFGCSFCYQDSTPGGHHAPLVAVEKVADRLAAARVFEVALGGGEPTLHPDFVPILRAFRCRGIVPNFTTRNLAWLAKPSFVAKVEEAAGAFAYSAHTAEDVARYASALSAAGWDTRRATVHVVMGTVPRETFGLMLALANQNELPVTLLGWKRTGRATAPPEYPYLDWWFDEARERLSGSVGIDTALAAESETAGILADVPRWQYHTADGPWSCYVDAVAGSIAPSSWQPERGSMEFDDNWLETFRCFT